jgi:Na+/proline symporter
MQRNLGARFSARKKAFSRPLKRTHKSIRIVFPRLNAWATVLTTASPPVNAAHRYNAAHLSVLDLVIIVGYLAAVVGVGAWFGRKQQTTSQYFLAGQRVPWWAISASIVATETSTITFISVPGIAYARGGDFTFLQLVFGYLVGRIAISILFIPSYFTGDLVTVYQLLQRRFGWRVRALASSLFIAMRTIADGVRLLLTAFVLAAVYGSVAGVSAESVITLCVVGIGVVMIIFTFYGGMEAVVWIEVVQLGIYIAGALAAAIVLTRHIPGGLSAAMELGRGYG